MTRKEIRRILLTQDSTKVYRLYKSLYGEIVKSRVVNFIKVYAPDVNPYPIVYGKYRERLAKQVDDPTAKGKIHHIVERLRYYMREAKDSHTKVPTMGHNHLYWCSPAFGHCDYNKSIICEIKGNERLCELLVAMGKKY